MGEKLPGKRRALDRLLTYPKPPSGYAEEGGGRDLAFTENALANSTKLAPEELQQLQEEAQSVACVNNLKQIGLAATRGSP